MQQTKQTTQRAIDFCAMKCSQNNQAFLICSSSQCQHNPFKCNFEACKCTQNHYKCSLLIFKGIINNIQQKRRVVSKYISQSFQEYDKIIDQMMDYISLIRQKASIIKQHYGMTEMEMTLIESLRSRNFEKLNGAAISHITNNSSKSDRKYIRGKQTIRRYWSEHKGLFQDFTKELQKNCLSDEQLRLDKVQTDLVKKWLQQNTKRTVKQMTPIFRASQYDFLGQQFHKSCDKYKNTLVVVKTDYNKVIGGFNPLSWSLQGQKQQMLKEDITKSAFIFSLNQKEKYDCTKHQNAIYIDNINGPCFGGHYNQKDEDYQNMDLCIMDKSNQANSCFSRFANVYNINNKYKNEQKSRTIFAGSKSDSNFSTIQYQIYCIVFNQAENNDQ